MGRVAVVTGRRLRWEGHVVSSVDERRAANNKATLNGLRANSFAAVVMLLIEFYLGVGANIYAKLPVAGSGKALFPAFGDAVTGGPIVLTLHALLGTILLITGISAVVRASLTRRPLLIVITSTALLAIIVAWLSGSKFAGDMADSASMAMALATGLSIACYALILFVAPQPRLKTDNGEKPRRRVIQETTSGDR
jgi:hypothetical protein